ncbi:MAG: hypothetical protein LAT65_10895 [Saccharospirillum sp.]|nr:hypothetical protein [Saccharospirillum sp.]
MTLFEREYPIPASLKEVLGARQSAGALLCIALLTVLAAIIWNHSMGPDSGSVGMWRLVLAWLLMLDIAAGAVANFTPGTNAFYAERPVWRWGFIAIHVHLPVVGWLLGLPLAPLLWVWGYTIMAACLVNLCHGRRWQPVLAGSLLCAGALGTALLSLSPWLLSLALLFMIKVLYAFAVNHYPEQEAPSA